MLATLDGYKTYTLSILVVIYAVAGFITGNLDANAAFQLLAGSGIASSLRHAISTTPSQS